MKNVKIVNHPVISDSLAYLRDKKTGIKLFRYHSDRVTGYVVSEALSDLSLKAKKITTPLESKIEVETLDENIVAIPVLRAGIAMLASVMSIVPEVGVGFVGLERDEKTAVARKYYWKLPKIGKDTTVLVTDPMLATGGSLLQVLQEISKYNPKTIKIACVVASFEGASLISKKYKNISIYTSALDDSLNSNKYIVPGLGDYGDRYFGT